jgi:glucosylceramidase
VARSIVLRAAIGGQALVAEGGGTLTATGGAGAAAFTLYDLDGGALKPRDLVMLRGPNGYWVGATNAGGSTVRVTATKPAEWETFRVVAVPPASPTEFATGQQMAILAWNQNHYLSAQDGGGGIVDAGSSVISGWEAFNIELGAPATEWLAPQSALAFTAGTPAANALRIDAGSRYQKIAGFGSSFTNTSAWVLMNQLTQPARTTLLKDAFSTSTGAGLTVMRIPFGSSDMEPAGVPAYSYTYSNGVLSLAGDLDYKVPAIQAALAFAPDLYLIGSPWSPPASLKTSNALIGGSLKQDATSLTAYAKYFVDTIKAFAGKTITIRMITPQNEPLYSPVGYPGSTSTADEEANFIGAYLGPALQQASLDVSILTYDHNWDQPDYPQRVLADSVAKPYVDGTAFHCYAGNIAVQETIHTAFPDRTIWHTECAAGPWEDDPFGGKMWLFIESSRNWTTGVVLWNLATKLFGGPGVSGGCDTCLGVFLVEANQVVRHVQYYALAHFTRFLKPGATRIGSSGGPANLRQVAFVNPDGSIVLVAHNPTALNMTIPLAYAGYNAEFVLPGGAAVTLVW